MTTENIDFEEALSTLGEVLASRGVAIDIVAVGGGALSLLGLISRVTKNIDIVALVRDGRLVSAKSLPPELEQARNDVASALGLPMDWLNAGPSQLLDFGLPDGFEKRQQLKPTNGELAKAAEWARGHDPSPSFLEMSRQALSFFGVTE